MSIMVEARGIEKQIKKDLTEKQAKIILQLQTLDSQDPILADTTPQVSELGTDAWQAEVHAKLVVVRSNLQNMSARISSTLKRINLGIYSQCKGCGSSIENACLQAMPTADLCLSCISSKSN